jgi:hypothetical protein
LERGRLVTAAKVWHSPPESGGRAPPHENSKKKKTAIAGRAVYWRKQKGHTTRRTLNKQSLWGKLSLKLIPEIYNK